MISEDFKVFIRQELERTFQQKLWGESAMEFLPILKEKTSKKPFCICCLTPETEIEIDNISGLCLYCQPCGGCGQFGTISGDRCMSCNWWDPS